MIGRRPLLAAALLAPAARLAAQPTWPDHPIRLVVPFPAGSVTDTIARYLAEPLGRELGQPVVVDNRAGGNGIVGTLAVTAAPPDGYTLLLLGVTSGALGPQLLRHPPYDPLRDLAQIGGIADAPYLLVVPPDSPARDLAGFIALARGRDLTFSHGNLSALIASAVMNRMAGVRMTAVPYRGGPEALTDVMAGRIDSTFTDFAAGLAQVQDGKLRALGVTTAEPFPLAPAIPPIASVLPGYEIRVWFGLSAPAATPAPIIARAEAALRGVVSSPGFVERVGRQGFATRPLSAAGFAEFLAAEVAAWGERARVAGLEPQ